MQGHNIFLLRLETLTHDPTFKRDLPVHSIKVSQHAKYLCLRSYCSKIIV